MNTLLDSLALANKVSAWNYFHQYEKKRKEDTIYLIHLTKSLFHNPIYFLTKLAIFPKNPKSKRFSRNLIHNKTNNES